MDEETWRLVNTPISREEEAHLKRFDRLQKKREQEPAHPARPKLRVITGGLADEGGPR